MLARMARARRCEWMPMPARCDDAYTWTQCVLGAAVDAGVGLASPGQTMDLDKPSCGPL